jgi:hypothetical protein
MCTSMRRCLVYATSCATIVVEECDEISPSVHCCGARSVRNIEYHKLGSATNSRRVLHCTLKLTASALYYHTQHLLHEVPAGHLQLTA